MIYLAIFISFGPIYAYWMHPYKRFNSWVIWRVKNRHYTEATVIEMYRLFEWANFLQEAGDLPDSAVLLPDNSNVIDQTASDTPVNWTHSITSNNTIKIDLLIMTPCV